MGMGFDDEVTIPVSIAVDKTDLNDLKSELSKVLDTVQKYEKAQGTKKEPYIVKGVHELESATTTALGEIDKLQRQFESISANTPFERLRNTQEAIAKEYRSMKSDIKEINKQWSIHMNQSQAIKKINGQITDVINKQKKARTDYNAELARAKKAFPEQPKTTSGTSKEDIRSNIADEEKRRKVIDSIEKRYEKISRNLANEKSSLEKTLEFQQSLDKIALDRVASARASKDASQASVNTLKASAAEQGKLIKSNEYLKQQEIERVKRLTDVNNKLEEQTLIVRSAMKGIRTKTTEDMTETGYKSGRERKVDAENLRRLREEQKAQRELEKLAKAKAKIERDEAAAANKATNNKIAMLKREEAAVRRSASQYYYKLRALKMLGFTMKSMSTTVDKFGKKMISSATKALSAYMRLIPGVNSLKKAISGIASHQAKMSDETKKLAKSSKGLNMTFGQLVKRVLAYGLGIRSLYMIFSKLRKAVSDGIGSMAQQISLVNSQMSSVVTSLNQMKAAVTAAVQPILRVLAPALERLSAIIANLSYQIASFIATLTGQSVVFKAARIQTDYAESLDKTGKSAKKAKKELAGFDELNVLHTKDDDGSDAFGGMSWDPAPISQKAAELANKLKDIWSRLMASLKDTWSEFKDYVVKSWKYALNQMKKLGNSIAKDFWRVWEETDTQKIFGNILVVLADIGRIVGNLAGNFRAAWEANENGYRTLAAIRDILVVITDGIRDAADYTVIWSDRLSFTPAFTAFADNLQSKVVPAVQQVVDLFVELYENVILKIIKDFVEGGLPQMINILGNVSTAIGNIAENVKNAIANSDTGVAIVNNLEHLIGIVADTIETCSENTAKWSKQLNFSPLFDSMKTALEGIEPAISAIAKAFSDLWNNTLLPFYSYLIEDGFPKLNSAISEIGGGDWSGFSQSITDMTKALEPFFELAWETLVQIFKDLASAIKDFGNSKELNNIVNSFKDWSTNADPEELAKSIEKLVESFIGLKAALSLVSKVLIPTVTGFMTIQNFFAQKSMTKEVARISTEIAKLNGDTALLTKNVTGLTFHNIIYEMKAFSAVLPTPVELIEKLARVLGGKGAGLTGALTAFTGVLTALKGGFDMMENGFSVGGEAIVAFGSILTTVGLILTGAVAAWPALIIGALVGVIANLGAFGDDILNWVWETGNNIREKIGTVFDNLGFYIGAAIHTVLATIITGLAELPGKIGNWITTVDWKEFGINILKGIFAIFLSVGQLISFIGTAIANLVSGFIRGLCTGFDMHSPSKKMEPYGKMILKGLLQGIISVIDGIAGWINSHIVTPILNAVKSAFGIVGGAATTFKTIGTNLISGLQNGMSNMGSSIKSYANSLANNIVSIFSSRMSSNTLWATGYNLLVGMVNGIINGFNMAYDRVRNGCSNIVNIARSIFNIHSPSKVFEEIGLMNMAGLTEGTDEGVKEADKSMEKAMQNLIPSVDVDNDLGKSFIDKLLVMKQSAVDIVNAMADEMSATMGNLDSIFTGNFDIASKMSKLSAIKTPNIAQGQVLPSTANFVLQSNNTEPNYDGLVDKLSKAIVDAITTTSYNNTDSGDTVIEIDGREVFRAVKRQSQLYQKSTGKSAFGV